MEHPFPNLHFSKNNAKHDLSYTQINSNINKLIQQLGQKIKKQICVNQQKKLLQYKQNLISAQKHYKQLNQTRTQQIIKNNICILKTQSEKIFNQYSLKSSDMNNLYIKLKKSLQKSIEYQNQLAKEVKYIQKQCKIAQAKGEVLDQQIKERERQMNETNNKNQKRQESNKIKSYNKLNTTELYMTNNENRLRMKIQFLKEYLNQLSFQQNTLESIYSKYDYSSCKNQQQKYKLIQSIFSSQQFKRYLYTIIFNKKQKKIQGKTKQQKKTKK